MDCVSGRRLTKAKIPPTPNVPEPLTFEEAQKMVQFEVNGIACRWNIGEPLEVISKEELSDEEPNTEVKPEAPPPGIVILFGHYDFLFFSKY